jgi:hypothetical protein
LNPRTRTIGESAYSNNRRDAIENNIDADSVAAHVCEIMAERAQWTGSASELLQVGTNPSGWPKSPRALAGRLRRRAQTFLRTSELRSPSAVRVGSERGQSITAIGETQPGNTVSIVSRISDKGHVGRASRPPSRST